jgi:hypothetical protein
MALVPGNPGGSPGAPTTPPGLREYFMLSGALTGFIYGGPVLGKIARPVGGFALRQVGKQFQKTMYTYRNPWVAYETTGEIRDMAESLKLGLTVIDIVEGSSSHGLVQNGGPSAPLQVSSTNADILSLGKISRPTRSSSAKRVIRPKSRKDGKNRCPPGHRWNGHRCVPIRKRS